MQENPSKKTAIHKEKRKPPASKMPARKSRIKRWTAGIFVLLILALIGGRIYLPYWVTDYVNHKIDALDGYSGSVKDIDIHLWRGAYQIHGLDIYKTNGGLKTPFVASRLIDFSVEWRALWRGKIVSEMDIETITLTFSKSQTGKEADWTTFIDDLTPFDINRLGVHGGKVSYVDPAAKPKVNLYIDNIQAEVTNLRNVDNKNVALPSDLRIQGHSIGNGKLAITGKGNVLRKIPDFDLDIKLENASLTALNEYTRDSIGVDFTSGTIGVYSELAAANGNVTGYVKPIISKMQLMDANDKDITPWRFLWEALVSAFMEIFKNHPQDQFALRIPIEGQFDNPQSNMWEGFWSIFRNAFVQAFPRATDGSINFRQALEAGKEPVPAKSSSTVPDSPTHAPPNSMEPPSHRPR